MFAHVNIVKTKDKSPEISWSNQSEFAFDSLGEVSERERDFLLPQYVLGSSTLYLALALLAMVVVFSAMAPQAFSSAYNLRSDAVMPELAAAEAVAASADQPEGGR